MGQMWADSAARQRLAELLERGEVARGYECQFIRKDGVKIRAVRDATGKTLYFAGFIEDIHERNLAAQKLRESEARPSRRAPNKMETILNTIPVPVLIAHDPECQDDIPALVEHFVQKYAKRMG
jgi:PAS domain-containing protein